MTRIDDVAKLAGVSTATVSRALRGLPEVSAETRSRVLAAAAHLGYVASPSASRLAGGKTHAVAVVVPRITRWFFATAVEAAEETLHQAGYDLLLYNLGGRERARRQLFQLGPRSWPEGRSTPEGAGLWSALHKRVDAVMLISTPLQPDDFEIVGGLAIPGITVSSGTQVPGWSSVRIDDVAAGRTATEHLLALGHWRIAHISGDAADELAFTAHIDRHRGYEDALCAAGVRPDPGLRVEAEFTVSGGARGTEELLRRGAPPTAIFAACDEMAMGAIAVLRQAGLRVPEDVSVVGIDDHDLAGAVGLTTVAQPAAEQGRLAAAMLLEPLRLGVGCGPTCTVLPTRLVVRESTAPTAVSRPL
jgi:DNA-binding LacI/PurR family transcriptional regulator